MQKRDWLADFLDENTRADVVIETLDIDYEDIKSLNKLNVVNTLRLSPAAGGFDPPDTRLYLDAPEPPAPELSLTRDTRPMPPSVYPTRSYPLRMSRIIVDFYPPAEPEVAEAVTSHDVTTRIRFARTLAFTLFIGCYYKTRICFVL